MIFGDVWFLVVVVLVFGGIIDDFKFFLVLVFVGFDEVYSYFVCFE